MRLSDCSFHVPPELTAPGAPYETEIRHFRGRDYTMFKHAPRSLNALLGEAMVVNRSAPDARMTEQDGSVLGFHAFDARSAALAASLQEGLGIAPGDHVAVVMANRAEWMIAFFAVLAVGAVPVLVNSRGAGVEITRAIAAADCRAAIFDEERYGLLSVAVPTVLLGEGQPDRPAPAMDFAVASAPRDGQSLHFAPRDAEDPALIMFSSGTTGHPKAIVHSQGGMAHSLTLGFLVNEAFDALYEREFGRSPRADLPRSNPPLVLASPMFHVAGLLPYLRAIVQGQPTVLLAKWNADAVFDLLERDGVTRLGLVPTMIFDLLASPRAQSGVLSQIRFLANGTAALPTKVAAAIRQALPQCFMLNTYGQTEMMERVATFGGRQFEQNLGAVGRVMPTMAIRILRDDGSEAQVGEAGEIVASSPATMLEYYNDPQATASAMQDGWLFSGDIGHFDEQGLLHIVDRKKNMVISGGENIYCAEVERVLAEHPAVAEAIAFGEPDPRLGERLVAVAVLKPGASAGEEDLKAHCKANLAIYKVPRALGTTRDALPRNATGKVAKGQFLERYERPWAR
jgi:acyl-CoA synthetase (AMP-forming)/AMP-acid ligase II